MIRVIKRNLLLILSLCFVLSLGCFAFVKTAQHQAKADAYVSDAFEMVEGAQLKLDGDGLRFVVRLGSDTYDALAENENLSLSFLIAPKSFFDDVDAGATPGEYENLSKKKQIDIPFNRIYVLDDGYYYANAVLTNIATAASSPQYEYNFVATAMIKDTAGVEDTVYADFSGKNIENNARTQYDVAQATVLSEEMDQTDVEDLVTDGPYMAWFGTSDYPVLVETIEKYERYEAMSSYDLGTCVFTARVAGEEDTVFISDREIAVKQFEDIRIGASSGSTEVSYTTKMHYGDEVGSIKFTSTAINNDGVPNIWYKMIDGTDADRTSGAYDEQYAGKYVTFNVYNDSGADFVDIALGWPDYWFRVPRGEWRQVVWPADKLWNNVRITITAYEYSTTTYSEPTRVALNGDVYFSKATLIDSAVMLSNNFGNTTTAIVLDDPVTVGHTDIVRANWNTIGTAYKQANYNYNVYKQSEFYGETAYVDGSVLAYAVPYGSSSAPSFAIGIGLSESTEVIDKVMYITMRGGNTNPYLQYSYNSTNYYSHGGVVETYDDGFVKYAFTFGQTSRSISSVVLSSSNLFYIWAVTSITKPHLDTVVIKDIEIVDLSDAVAAVREVEGSDTVFMFDNAIGVGQIRSNQASTIKYNTDMHVQGENGSLEATFSNQTQAWLAYDLFGAGSNMSSGQYVVFYAYNDTDADFLDVALYSNNRFRIPKGEWGMVIWPAVAASQYYVSGTVWMQFFTSNFNGDYSSPSVSTTNINGKIYLSKAVLLDSDEIYQMPTSNDDAYVRIGSVDIDSASWAYHGNYNPSSSYFNSPTYSGIYYVDGAIRFLGIPSTSANTEKWNGVKFYLSDGGVYRQNNKLYVTAKGLDDTVILYGYNATGAASFGQVGGVKEQTLADGFEIYSFDISKIGTSYYSYKSLAFALIHPSLLQPDMSEIIIKDMWFASQRTALENTVDFFVDVPEGREIKVLQITDTQIIDSSTDTHGYIQDATTIASYRNTVDHDSMDIYCFKYLRELIEETQPDFIIMTGDNVYGKYDDDGHILTRLIECMESFGIPWAPIIGNHDAATALGIDWVCEQYEKAENCLFKQRSLSGNGNYTVGIRQGGELKRLFVMLDSNGYSDSPSTANGHTYTTRGFANDQIEWYTNTVTAVKTAVPGVKVSFVFHIQMAKFYYDLQEVYGDTIFPTKNTMNMQASIDAIEGKEEGDFGFVGETWFAYPWYGSIASGEESAFDGLQGKETDVYNGIVELGVDSIFIGHAHMDASSVVNSDGIRVQFGLKSSRHDYLQVINKSTGQFVEYSTSTMYWLDNKNTNTTECPLIGGTVIPVSSSDGTVEGGYNYYCAGAGQGLDPTTWYNPS